MVTVTNANSCFAISRFASCQEFRALSGKVLSWIAVGDFVMNPDQHGEKGALAEVMKIVASFGLSKVDLHEDLRSRLEPTPEKPAASAKAKAKATSKKRARAQATAPVADDADEDEEVPSKKKKSDKSNGKKKK